MTGRDLGPEPSGSTTEESGATTRRGFLLGAIAGATGGALVAGAAMRAFDDAPVTGSAPSAGSPAGDTRSATSTAPGEAPGGAVVDPHGLHQAGIDRPGVLQRHLELAILDLPDVLPSRDALATTLDGLGERIASLVAGDDERLGGLSPTRLTVTVGLGPRVVQALWGKDAPAATSLPVFARDHLTVEGGDVLVLVRCDEGPAAARVLSVLASTLALPVRWSATGFAGPPEGLAARNVTGFHDGLSIPRTSAELAETVWNHDVPGATTLVVRRMPVDLVAFGALTVEHQQDTVGRVRSTGVPLSGGGQADGPDLGAKTAEGQYLVPVAAHIRRAHPLPAGLDGLMLRRSYSYASGPGDEGLLFMAFGSTLDLFVRTQQRLDEQDALMAFARTTASGSFLVLPGFTPERGLGSSLRS